MKVVADLHLHSRFARACSKELTVPAIAATAARKGMQLVGTGDFLHPAWRKELREHLEEAEPGLYKSRNFDISIFRNTGSVRFILATEISCIYSRGGKVRRVHHLVFVPSFAAVEAIVAALLKRGANLNADGRPIIGIDSEALARIVFDSDPQALLIPAHAWTPWFAIFGSKSGFDRLEECFGELTPRIPAIETGLSSDPPMNWRLSALDSVALVSGSDAHSLPNIGREATVFDLQAFSYANITAAIRNSSPQKLSVVSGQLSVGRNDLPTDRIVATIEFYPEEGMYHYDGHRACDMRMTPEETKKHHGLCPRCHLSVTVGVLNRVDVLADRSDGFRPPGAPDFVSLVELDKIIAESFDIRSRKSKQVQEEYDKILSTCGNELAVLTETPYLDLARVTDAMVVEGIRRVRERKLTIAPGFDGQYGSITIFNEQDRARFAGGAQEKLGV